MRWKIFVKLVNCLGSEHEEEYLWKEERERIYMEQLGQIFMMFEMPAWKNRAQWLDVKKIYHFTPECGGRGVIWKCSEWEIFKEYSAAITFNSTVFSIVESREIHKSKLKTSN